MRDKACVEFLQAWLPRLGLRWSGYRKVRRTVCKRIGRRLRELGLSDVEAYNAFLEATPGEWQRLDALCRIPISRFCRDRKVFEAIGQALLPELARRSVARRARTVRCWSAGCASGEEAYSLRLVWAAALETAQPAGGIRIIATDAEPTMLRRAEIACYGEGSLIDLAPETRDRAFTRSDDRFCLRPELREGIDFMRQDIRREAPRGLFDLILCRNLVFTYFDARLQDKVLARLDRHLRAEGFLVLGSHERLPAGTEAYSLWRHGLPIYRKHKTFD